MNPINHSEQIRKTLQISPMNYEHFQFMQFVIWSETQAKRFGILEQDKIFDSSLWKYYQTLWKAQLELPLMNDWSVFFEVMTPSDLEGHLRAYAQRLHRFFPKTIFKELYNQQKKDEKNIRKSQLA